MQCSFLCREYCLYEMPLSLPKVIQSLSWSNHCEVAEVRCTIRQDVFMCSTVKYSVSSELLLVGWCVCVCRWGKCMLYM